MYTDYSNQQSNIINGGSPFTKVNPSVPHPVQAPIPQQAYAFNQGYAQNNFDSEKQ